MKKIEENNKSQEKFEFREYQNEAVLRAINFVKDFVRGKIKHNLKNVDFENASLLEMATGSGKTFSVGKIIDGLITLRDRYNRKYGKKEFEGLNFLFLTNRIDGLNQFRDDLIHGRELINHPIISPNILENIVAKTFHSKADNLEDLDLGHFSENETEEVETFSIQNGRIKDNMLFCTFQTAILKDILSKLPYVDIIIIDEAHNVKIKGDYKELIKALNKKGRNGNNPYILPVTATPTNVTKKIFGTEIFRFGLAEYLASEYSPRVEYKLIASSIASISEIQQVQFMIEEANNIIDIKYKKKFVKKIKEKFNKIMSSYSNLEKLIQDILIRIMVDNGDINETIIFANSIEEADNIKNEINKELGGKVALSYHSKNDRNHALERLRYENDKVKIIVAVGKLNESVDLPLVSNIVFWRDTDVEKIFLQQFGRGLRGNSIVKYYDYVGGVRNFSWIGNIYEEYKNYSDVLEGENNIGSGEKKLKFKLIGGTVEGIDHKVDLSFLGFEIAKLERKLRTITEIDIIKYFKENGTLEYWKTLTTHQRNLFKINGLGFTAIANIMKIKGDPKNKLSIYYEFLSKIFSEELKTVSKEDIIKNFEENGTLEYWKNLTQNKKLEFKIDGLGLKSIARIMNVKGNPIGSIQVYYELLSKIFGEELNKTSKEDIIIYFKENGTLEYWKSFKSRKRSSIKIDKLGLKSMAGIMNIKGDPIKNTPVYIEFLSKVFGKELNVLSQEDVIKYFKEKGTEQYWKKITTRERIQFKIDGLGIKSIARIMNVKGNPMSNNQIYFELLSKIFGEDLNKE